MRSRRTFTREFKVNLLRELENGKSTAEISRRHSIHPSLISKWRREYRDDPGEAFSGCGNLYKEDAKIAERERLIGQLYAENALLKKAIADLEAYHARQRLREGGGSI